jgi:phosphoribosylglycinamide formyltransferase-1
VAAAAEQRLRLVAICETLPEVTSEPADRHVVFRVRGRTFAYFQDDHHGDGRVALVCKVDAGEDEALIGSDPDRYFRSAYSRRGWVSYRLDRPDVAWDLVEELVVDSYRRVAPKRLARATEDRDTGQDAGTAFTAR